MLGQQSLGGAVVHSMIALTVNVMVPAGELQKPGDQLVVAFHFEIVTSLVAVLAFFDAF